VISKVSFKTKFENNRCAYRQIKNYVIQSAILVNFVKINKIICFYSNNNNISGKTFVDLSYILINK